MISKICFHDVTLPSVYSAHPKHQAQGTTSTGQGLRNVYPAETPCPWYNWRSFPESSALGTPARWASGAAPGPSWSSSWCWCWYPAGFQGPRKRRSGASCINMYTVYSHLYYIICEHAANYNKWSFIYIYIYPTYRSHTGTVYVIHAFQRYRFSQHMWPAEKNNVVPHSLILSLLTCLALSLSPWFGTCGFENYQWWAGHALFSLLGLTNNNFHG